MNIFETAKILKQEEQQKIEELKNEKKKGQEAKISKEQELINKAKSVLEPILEEFKEAGYQVNEIFCKASRDIGCYNLKNEKNEFRLTAEKYYRHKLDVWGDEFYIEEYQYCIEIFDRYKKTRYSKKELCEFGEDLSEALAKYMTKYI